MIIRLTSGVLTLSVLAASSTAAARDDDLARCAQISSALDRLDCYDALARRRDVLPAATEVATPPGDPVVRATPAPATAPQVVRAAEPAPVADATPAATKTTGDPDGGPSIDDFGFESRAFERGAQSVRSRYDGDFTGWSGKTLFRLENGQVWKQSQAGRLSHRRDRPIITIKKAAFGSYLLSVDGINKTVRVKRVK